MSVGLLFYMTKYCVCISLCVYMCIHVRVHSSTLSLCLGLSPTPVISGLA